MLSANLNIDEMAFRKAALNAIRRADRNKITPAFRGLVIRLVQTLLNGDSAYAGLPQFTGSTVGNIQVGPKGTEGMQNDELTEEYREKRYEQFLDGAWEPYDNSGNQNATRMNKSLARAKRYVKGLQADGRGHAVSIYIPSEHLENYKDWGGESVWRAENMETFPISIKRLRRRLRNNPQSFINAR